MTEEQYYNMIRASIEDYLLQLVQTGPQYGNAVMDIMDDGYVELVKKLKNDEA